MASPPQHVKPEEDAGTKALILVPSTHFCCNRCSLLANALPLGSMHDGYSVRNNRNYRYVNPDRLVRSKSLRCNLASSISQRGGKEGLRGRDLHAVTNRYRRLRRDRDS